MTTDTPRTDAHYATTKTAWPTEDDKDFAKRLERELNLQKQITKGWLVSRDVIIEERDKLEAEVERLRKLLNVPIFLASDGTVTLFNPPLK